MGGTVAFKAERDINVVGGTVSAALSLMAQAGKDINVITTTSTNRGGDDANGFANTVVDRVASLMLEPGDVEDGVAPAERSLVVEAGRNVEFQAARISNTVEGADTVIKARNDIVLSTVDTSHEQRIRWDAKNHLSFGQSPEVGSEIDTLGNTLFDAGEAFDARAVQVQTSKALEIKAVKDVKIAAGKAIEKVESTSFTKKKGLFSSRTSTRHDQTDSTYSQASGLSGDTISITSGKNITVLGSDVVSQYGTKFKAARHISILADTEKVSELNFQKTTKSGMFGGGGLGINFGSQHQSTDQTQTRTTSVASTVASIDGNVLFEAGLTIAKSAANFLRAKAT